MIIPPPEAMVIMGRVAAAFAVSGWVRIHVFTERADGLLRYRDWWLRRNGQWRQGRGEEGPVQGRGGGA